MSVTRRLTATAAATVLLAGAALATAPAASALTAGDNTIDRSATLRTAVTTNAGIAGALLKAGILPYSVSPGRTDRLSLRPLALTYSFPITGLVGGTYAGAIPNEVTHNGGIAFVNLKNGKRIVVRDFTVDLNGGDAVGQTDEPALVGSVFSGPVPDGTRVALFTIDLANATADTADAQVSGAQLKLTGVAAGALNADLGTGLFAEGLNVFSARVNN